MLRAEKLKFGTSVLSFPQSLTKYLPKHVGDNIPNLIIMETENYSFEFIGEGNTNEVAVCYRGVALSHFHIGVKFIGQNSIHPCRDCVNKSKGWPFTTSV